LQGLVKRPIDDGDRHRLSYRGRDGMILRNFEEDGGIQDGRRSGRVRDRRG
jgi:hypothetical protein